MDERSLRAGVTPCGLPYFAEDEVLGRGHAGGMGDEGAIEGDDAAPGKLLTKVVVGPAVPEPQLEHRPLQCRHERDDVVEDAALGADAADEAFETAHRGDLGRAEWRWS